MAAVSSHRFEILQCTFYKPSYTFPLLWKYYHILCLLSNNLYRKYHFMRYHLHAKDGRSIWWKIKVERLLSHISSTGDDGNILSTEWYFLTLTHISSPEMTPYLQLVFFLYKFWLTSPHRRWRLWFIYSTTLVWILTHISSPEMTLFFDTFPLFCTFWLTSPHRRWHYGGLWGSGDFYDFDSHLLTGDDVCDAALFYCQEWFWLTSPHRRWLWQPLRQQFPMSDFDSHLLTGDDSTRSWLIPVRLILTHISSPEMTLTAIETTISNVWFWLTSPHRRWQYPVLVNTCPFDFDSHLLTGDDESMENSFQRRFEFWLTSPHRRWRSCQYPINDIYKILTHISSPEMTVQQLRLCISGWNFDSHLLTGDDKSTHAAKRRYIHFDSHLLTGDDDTMEDAVFLAVILTHISSPEMTSLENLYVTF